ncbi:hypothetical protein ZYGM_000948 [Zygosaccharomyces mellis]|uniref:Peptidase M20 dimerisation domain-containing protein n=1 Tax=Zygosaccharomyces mellis TaxID=42258 RepID=A0A4C2ECW4_9SACH|nr:hypothetical protein ZYGM_000948 [Zygosaccharomyces mellis]
MSTPSPGLIHRWDHNFSILSIVTFPKKKLLFAGTQDSKILVFNLPTYNLVSVLTLGDIENTHTRSSVLCLERSSDEKYLFSGGADSLVRIWSIYDVDSLNSSIQVEEVATVYSLTDIGDIFSLRYLDTLDTLVFGCQNASLLFLDNIFDRILEAHGSHEKNIDKLPHRRYDKFFDSLGPSGRTGSPAPRLAETSSNAIHKYASKEVQMHRILEVPSENIVNYAHNGFIYSICKLCLKCSTLLEDGKKHEHVHSHDYSKNSTAVSECIISGGGDGISKMWFLSKNEKGAISINSVAAKLDNEDTVISQAVEFPFLYCGLTDGVVKIWDLSTKQLVSTLHTPQKYDIISISVYMDHIFAINESGTTLFYENEVVHWKPNQGKMLSSDIFTRHDAPTERQISFLTGANDGSLTLWDLSEVMHSSDWGKSEEFVQALKKQDIDSAEDKSFLNSEEMLETLRDLISFQSVSQNPDTAQQLASRRCASHLQKLFVKFGATKATLLPVKDGKNPIAFALFKGKNLDKKRILWYGHYDVVSGNQHRWLTDPFLLTCDNGFMKARGVSDNKGPLVAALYSVANLVQRDQLLNDVVFLVEGSEEIGSPGLAQACMENRDLIGPQIDWIFLSNSTWVDQENPCLNYGLRGVINAQITVWGEQPDRHSGIDGGLRKEPAADLIKLISKLQDDDGKILIPGFYEPLKDLSEVDFKRLNKVVEFANMGKEITTEDLVTNWTKPSLSVTTMNISGPGNITVIPQSATIGVSIRLVPEQEVGKIKDSLKKYITQCFDRFSSGNHLEISIVNEAEAWLGDPTNHAYEVLKEALTFKWGKEPLLVREGGSIPCIRALERLLAAPAVQIPCGQSTDNAHLDNENLRIENWTYMTEILAQVFNRL